MELPCDSCSKDGLSIDDVYARLSFNAFDLAETFGIEALPGAGSNYGLTTKNANDYLIEFSRNWSKLHSWSQLVFQAARHPIEGSILRHAFHGWPVPDIAMFICARKIGLPTSKWSCADFDLLDRIERQLSKRADERFARGEFITVLSVDLFTGSAALLDLMAEQLEGQQDKEVSPGGDEYVESPPKASGGGLDFESLAVAILMQNPGLTDTRIAEKVGCNRKSLYRFESYKAARKLLKRDGQKSLACGVKTDGHLEAWDAGE